MLKLIVAYKPHDLFAEWNYVLREEDDLYAFEYRIAKLRYESNNPEYFKKLVFSRLTEDRRQSIQELGDLEFDALVFVDEASGKVWLRYHDETNFLKDFRTAEEQKTDQLKELEQKFCKTRYLENREELDEFLAALEVFNEVGDYDEIEVVQFIKGDAQTTQTFPILVVLEKHEGFDWNNDHNYLNLMFTLVDSTLGRK